MRMCTERAWIWIVQSYEHSLTTAYLPIFCAVFCPYPKEFSQLVQSPTFKPKLLILNLHRGLKTFFFFFQWSIGCKWFNSNVSKFTFCNHEKKRAPFWTVHQGERYITWHKFSLLSFLKSLLACPIIFFSCLLGCFEKLFWAYLPGHGKLIFLLLKIRKKAHAHHSVPVHRCHPHSGPPGHRRVPWRCRPWIRHTETSVWGCNDFLWCRKTGIIMTS